MMKEFVASQLIGTPLEPPARLIRQLATLPKRLERPELKELYAEPSRMEQLLDAYIQEGMNCIDVGCHLGAFLHRIRQLSPSGKHIAIEPIPYKAQWLKRKYADVEIHQTALSDEPGQVEFFIHATQSAFSGMKVNGHNFSDRDRVERLQVPCQRLDDLVPQGRKIDFLKIDVEGAELHVLRGATEILHRHHPAILFECNEGGLELFGLTPKDMHDFLQAQGYSLYLIKDWSAGRQPLSAEAFATAMQYPWQAGNFFAC